MLLADVDPTGQHDRQAVTGGTGQHQGTARVVVTGHAKATHALDLQRVEHREHLAGSCPNGRSGELRHLL